MKTVSTKFQKVFQSHGDIDAIYASVDAYRAAVENAIDSGIAPLKAGHYYGGRFISGEYKEDNRFIAIGTEGKGEIIIEEIRLKENASGYLYRAHYPRSLYASVKFPTVLGMDKTFIEEAMIEFVCSKDFPIRPKI